jgi:hypothetical protein
MFFREGTFTISVNLTMQESFSNRLKDLSEPTNTNLYISNLPLEVDEQVVVHLITNLTTSDSMSFSNLIVFTRVGSCAIKAGQVEASALQGMHFWIRSLTSG